MYWWNDVSSNWSVLKSDSSIIINNGNDDEMTSIDVLTKQ